MIVSFNHICNNLKHFVNTTLNIARLVYYGNSMGKSRVRPMFLIATVPCAFLYFFFLVSLSLAGLMDSFSKRPPASLIDWCAVLLCCCFALMYCCCSEGNLRSGGGLWESAEWAPVGSGIRSLIVVYVSVTLVFCFFNLNVPFILNLQSVLWFLLLTFWGMKEFYSCFQK